ncbi:MAG: glycosyltransferase [Christensenellales bacterium]
MVKLSLCMIVKNEEDVLDRCLNSCYKLFDEIIIVDTGSKDKTKEIAKRYTNKIYDFKWCDDFSKARNFSIRKCTCEYFMWLDADDVITAKNLKALLNLKNQITNEDIIYLKYDIDFNENNKPTFSFFRERIIKNNGKFLFNDAIHEAITPSENICFVDNISIEHRKIKKTPKGRNLKIYNQMIKNKKDFTPRMQFYYSRELMYNNKIDLAIVNFNKFLKNKNAFIENKIEACLNLSNCYLQKNDFNKALKTLFESFTYSLPRSEILCEIGKIYQYTAKYTNAVYYYKLALKNKPNFTNLGFIIKECYDFVPYINLTVCYYNLKDYKNALKYNNLAKKLKPENETILNNEKIIKNMLSSENS